LLGLAALLLALADLALVLTNRGVRRETDEQRTYIEQTVQLNGVRDNLVRQIARAAIEDKDQALRDLLVSTGFRIQTESAPGATPSPGAVSAAPALVAPPSAASPAAPEPAK
jgi:hypothetical protein